MFGEMYSRVAWFLDYYCVGVSQVLCNLQIPQIMGNIPFLCIYMYQRTDSTGSEYHLVICQEASCSILCYPKINSLWMLSPICNSSEDLRISLVLDHWHYSGFPPM